MRLSGSGWRKNSWFKIRFLEVGNAAAFLPKSPEKASRDRAGNAGVLARWD
jgi:hypothetical protein